jgi:hypothetical protein
LFTHEPCEQSLSKRHERLPESGASSRLRSGFVGPLQRIATAAANARVSADTE